MLPANPLSAAVTMLAFTVLLWGIEAYDQVTGQWLDADGIVPRSVDGLDGVLWAPLLHGSWAHLIANTLPFLIFGFLVMAHGIGRFVIVTGVIWLVGGLGVWLTGAPGTVHIGMSGVIFGWLTYLLVRGFFARSGRQILLAVVLFFLWGSVLLGVLPGQPGVCGRGTCSARWPACWRRGWWPARGRSARRSVRGTVRRRPALSSVRSDDGAARRTR